MNVMLSWCIIGAVSIANMYLGRLFAVWDLPRTVVARPSRKASAIAFLTMLSGVGFFIWNQKAQWYPFTLKHAAILSGSFAGSYLMSRAWYGSGQPPVPWPDYLNLEVEKILEICREHGWDLTSADSVNRLADAKQLHFDEGDYDALVQKASDLEHELEQLRRLPETADGQPDYDHACATKIVSLTNALAGYDGYEGIIAGVEHDFDLSGFDRQAFQELRWLAEGLKRQWRREGYIIGL